MFPFLFFFFFSQFSLQQMKGEMKGEREAGITTRHSIGNKENYIRKLVEIRTINVAGCRPLGAFPRGLTSERMTNDVTWTRAIACLAWCEDIFGDPSTRTRRDCVASCPRPVGHAARDLVNRACRPLPSFLLLAFLINASHRRFLRLRWQTRVTTRWSLED